MMKHGLPLSERLATFTNHTWTKEELIYELRALAERFPDRIITRNFFRTQTGIPEAAWTSIFGTFENFKRAANIIRSLPEKRMERYYANHYEHDHYRQMTKLVADWGGKYNRPATGRWQMIAVAADFHDIETDPFCLRVWLDTLKRAQPDVMCLAGDVLDLAEFSRFSVDPRDWDASGRMKFAAKNILKPMREACPKAQFDYLGGNHEHWILRHFCDRDPGIMDFLHKFHGMDLRKFLKLDECEINYISKDDLSAFHKRQIEEEVQRNNIVYHDAVLVTHNTKYGLEKRMPGCSAHSHKLQTWSFESPPYGSFTWTQLGGMHQRTASYCDAEKWNNGFALVHVDVKSRTSTTEYIQVGETSAVSGGRYYFRDERDASLEGHGKARKA